MKKLSWFIFFLIFLSSCLDDPDCFQLHNDVLRITFRVIGTGQGDSVMLRNFNTEELTFDFDPEGDELVPITSFGFNLNYFKELETLNFNGANVTNTMSLAYTVKNQFISEDCGSSFVLSGLRLLSHDFDSARVINLTPSKTKNGGTNIEIYRCPETDTLTLNFNQLYATSNAVTITNPRSTFISHEFAITTDGTEVFSGRAATVKLPVDLTKNQMKYEFNMDGATQTLNIKYDLVTEQRYRSCGIQTFVTNLTLGEHTFDSVSYGLNSDDEPLRTLQDPHVANFRIYDCPPTNLMQVGFRKDNVVQQVTIKGITGPHIAENLLADPVTASTIEVPVDLTSNESTFYIQYADDTIDTLTVQYTRTDLTLFNSCGAPVITGITSNLENVNVISNRPTLQFPPVTHVEIILD